MTIDSQAISLANGDFVLDNNLIFQASTAPISGQPSKRLMVFDIDIEYQVNSQSGWAHIGLVTGYWYTEASFIAVNPGQSIYVKNYKITQASYGGPGHVRYEIQDSIPALNGDAYNRLHWGAVLHTFTQDDSLQSYTNNGTTTVYFIYGLDSGRARIELDYKLE